MQMGLLCRVVFTFLNAIILFLFLQSVGAVAISFLGYFEWVPGVIGDFSV